MESLAPGAAILLQLHGGPSMDGSGGSLFCEGAILLGYFVGMLEPGVSILV